MTLKVQVYRRVARYHHPFTLYQVASGFDVPLHRIVDILGVMVKTGKLRRIKIGLFAPLDYLEKPDVPKADRRSEREKAYAKFRESLHIVVPTIEVNAGTRYGD